MTFRRDNIVTTGLAKNNVVPSRIKVDTRLEVLRLEL
jgi:hypothetical protein